MIIFQQLWIQIGETVKGVVSRYRILSAGPKNLARAKNDIEPGLNSMNGFLTVLSYIITQVLKLIIERLLIVRFVRRKKKLT